MNGFSMTQVAIKIIYNVLDARHIWKENTRLDEIGLLFVYNLGKYVCEKSFVNTILKSCMTSILVDLWIKTIAFQDKLNKIINVQCGSSFSGLNACSFWYSYHCLYSKYVLLAAKILIIWDNTICFNINDRN